MKKRNALLCALAVCLLAACQSHTKPEKSGWDSEQSEQTTVASKQADIPFTLAERYFFKNNVGQLESPVITTEKEFRSLFGTAPVMGESGKPTAIDFAKQYVIAVVKPETDFSTTLEPVSLKRDEQGTIVFTYQVKKGEKQSYAILPCLLIIVDKTETGNVALNEID